MSCELEESRFFFLRFRQGINGLFICTLLDSEQQFVIGFGWAAFRPNLQHKDTENFRQFLLE